jgi:hypothetical protein
MKLPASTWILILLTLGLGGFVYYQEIYRPKQLAASQTEIGRLFSFNREEIKKIEIVTTKETIALEKTTRQVNPWQLKQPKDVAANTGVVIFLVDLLVNTKRDRIVEVSSTQLTEYGLDKPTAKIEIVLQNKQKYTLNLGRLSFDEQFIYAQIPNLTAKDDRLELLLLPKNFQDAVMRDSREWKNKDLTEEDKKIDTEAPNSTTNQADLKPKTGTVKESKPTKKRL